MNNLRDKKLIPGILLFIVSCLVCIINQFNLLGFLGATGQFLFNVFAIMILLLLLSFSLYARGNHNYRKHFLFSEIVTLFIWLIVSFYCKNTMLMVTALTFLFVLFVVNLTINYFQKEKAT